MFRFHSRRDADGQWFFLGIFAQFLLHPIVLTGSYIAVNCTKLVPPPSFLYAFELRLVIIQFLMQNTKWETSIFNLYQKQCTASVPTCIFLFVVNYDVKVRIQMAA